MPPVLSEIHGTWSLNDCALALKNDRFRKDDHHSHIFCVEILSLTILHQKKLKFQLLRLALFLCISWFFPFPEKHPPILVCRGLVCRGVPSSPVFRCHRNQNDTRETQTCFLGTTGTSGSAAAPSGEGSPGLWGYSVSVINFP